MTKSKINELIKETLYIPIEINFDNNLFQFIDTKLDKDDKEYISNINLKNLEDEEKSKKN